jgi:hypothetical protein
MAMQRDPMPSREQRACAWSLVAGPAHGRDAEPRLTGPLPHLPAHRADLEQALFTLSLLPASRPAAAELTLCLSLSEALAQREALGDGGGGADVAGARDTLAAAAVQAVEPGGGAHRPLQLALSGIDEWQVGAGVGVGLGRAQIFARGGPHAALMSRGLLGNWLCLGTRWSGPHMWNAHLSPAAPQALALLTVRLLTALLRHAPSLLGPRTPGALAGVLGRFLACGSPDLQVGASSGRRDPPWAGGTGCAGCLGSLALAAVSNPLPYP